MGDVPRGLPSLKIPDGQLMWDHAGTVALAAVALVLIGFSQTAGDARAFAAKHRYQIDINQESTAQSLANLAAGVFQGMPVSTSLSASSLNDHSGAKTGLASLTSGVTVLLTLLILAPLFSNLPKPVLAALIIEAVVMGMMNVPEMRRLARVQKVDFWIAVAAILGTLVFGVLAGVIIGIGLSLIWLVAVATHPAMPDLGREPGTQVFREAGEHPGDEVLPAVAVIRFDGGLFFATADALEDRLREVVHAKPGTTGIVLDCGGINFVDSQGAAKMDEIVTLARDAGVNLRLTRLKPAVRAVLERDGVIEHLGADMIHGNIHRAVEAEQAAAERGPTAPSGLRSRRLAAGRRRGPRSGAPAGRWCRSAAGCRRRRRPPATDRYRWAVARDTPTRAATSAAEYCSPGTRDSSTAASVAERGRADATTSPGIRARLARSTVSWLTEPGCARIRR